MFVNLSVAEESLKLAVLVGIFHVEIGKPEFEDVVRATGQTSHLLVDCCIRFIPELSVGDDSGVIVAGARDALLIGVIQDLAVVCVRPPRTHHTAAIREAARSASFETTILDVVAWCLRIV